MEQELDKSTRGVYRIASPDGKFLGDTVGVLPIETVWLRTYLKNGYSGILVGCMARFGIA
jgi:hypothetical protein